LNYRINTKDKVDIRSIVKQFGVIVAGAQSSECVFM